MPNKVLIIKLGYSETLDQEIGTTTSLGDVLRTTVILNYFKGRDVTWLVDEKAYPLLDGNPRIKRILIFGPESVLQLQRERFDTVINLEKGPAICALSDSVNARKRFGFRFDPAKGAAQAHNGAEMVLSLCLDLEKKKENLKFWQDALASMIGKRWSEGEKYILGYKPRSKVKYDIGFNWVVGDKWPNKAWPKRNWQKLGKLLKGKYSVCWQKGLGDLDEYMDWINSCRLIVTNDSLGMHLAIALRKKMIALFGPSSSKEVCLYERGVKLMPKSPYKCAPCLNSVCVQKVNCMEYITPEAVKEEIVKMLPAKRR
ncbi:MAG: glycosyltransferase family 9 protein [Candidatus Omnitrophica bacterium]|nr:glycosyltransferase family 9 protein [Candidatus Omnitrophota bacterium]MDD5310188.1 glycosyltransferase family 9 protein [Candidatus Omnitrophota bacterium]MDD5546235.1 glycosyltransferase family 9 protein [Candidatus Omnitrophota bacterium]